MRFLTTTELSEPLPLSLGISGGSGTGKTFSSLRVARGIAAELMGAGAPVAYADTENRRALHYRDSFPEILGHYIDFGPNGDDGNFVGYPPERWIDMLDFVEESGAGALVMDGFSPAWEGVNGVLDLQSAILAKMGGGDQNNLRAWAQIKPRYRKLVNRLIQFDIPVIICTRAKPVIQDPRTRKNLMPTKSRREDVPWDWAADKDLMFEMTTMVFLDPLHPGCPLYQIKVPDQFKPVMPADQPLTEDTGRLMARWTRDQSTANETKALMDAARATARGGSEAMQIYWKGLSRESQAILLPIRSELRETAAGVDAAPAEQENFFRQPLETAIAATEAEPEPQSDDPPHTGDSRETK